MNELGVQKYLTGRSIAELLQKKQVLEPFANPRPGVTSDTEVDVVLRLVQRELNVREGREIDFLKRMGEAQCQKPETS